MLITLRELRKAGLDNSFITVVRGYIPDTVEDAKASKYLKEIIKIAHEDGLVGPSMMRQIARMRSKAAVKPALYSKIIEFKKDAEKVLAKRAAREAKKEEAAEVETAPKKRKRKKVAAKPEPETVSPELGDPEPEQTAPSKRKRKSLKAKKELGKPAKVVKFEYEGYEFQSIKHPDAPAALKKFDHYWPVPLDKLWKYRTSGPITFPMFTGKPRTKGQYLTAAKRKGVTKAQFEAIWKQWTGKKGRELGWIIEEVRGGKFRLRALDPLTELVRF